VSYTLEFTSLAQARSYFGVPTAQEAGLASRAEKACRLRVLGKTQKQIAQELGVSVSTVKRCLHG
jgi:DNA-binding NarL/FixJ family response regulator